jgi:hypothetical protein
VIAADPMPSIPKSIPMFEKRPRRIRAGVSDQLDELIAREKRCEYNIREMHRLLLIMQREREDIVDSIQKMEELLEETD